MRFTPSTLSLGFAIASVGLLIAAPLPPEAAQAAATAASAPPASTKPKAAPTKSNDPCGDAKSKWAHLKCEQFNASAPGDEYFGRMKLSYLGIDNTYKDGSISAGDNTTDQRLIAKLDFASEALGDGPQSIPTIRSWHGRTSWQSLYYAKSTRKPNSRRVGSSRSFS